MMQIADKYAPQQIESKWYDYWMEHRLFHSEPDEREPYTIVIPPPNVTGMLHMGHMLNNTLQDVLVRRARMQGKNACWVPGTDHASIATEAKVVAKLKAEGIEKSSLSREEFLRHAWDWKEKYGGVILQQLRKLGASCDWERTCFTMDEARTESVLRVFCDLYEKGLIYRGVRMVNWDPSAQTALSDEEVVFKESHGKLYYLRYKVEGTDRAIIVATTRPETILGDTALCVNPKEDYTRLRYQGEIAVMADALIPAVLGEDAQYEKLETVKGEALCGMEYVPLWDAKPQEHAYYVVADGYVTLTDGTGIVHIAPAFGEDDARVGRDNGLPFVQLVDPRGCFTPGTRWEGRFVKDCDPDILDELRERGLLVKAVPYAHDYPFCWRCDTPLLYYARAGWFIRMTAVRDELLANNRSIRWLPENIKEGRMGNFLENVVDWALTRERYWGTPLPVWVCPQGHIHVVGSIAELRAMGRNVPENIELHRPYVDEIVLTCPQCGQEMHRVKEVIDCWYDSGSMPFAQWHYPFEHKEEFEARFPAQFISEAIDQTRGWFYTLLAISTLVFGRAPFETCLVLGHVQDMEGRKMSKHLGNVIAPADVLEKQGADAVRWYFYVNGCLLYTSPSPRD